MKKKIEPSGYCYPNTMARAYLTALESIMGVNGFNAVLHLAHLSDLVAERPPDNWEREFDFAYLSALNAALDDLFSTQGGSWLQARAGRASFARALQGLEALAGVRDASFARLPLDAKVRIGVTTTAEVINQVSDQVNRVDQRSEYYFYIVERCPACWGRTADQPVCSAVKGCLQEGLRWITGGREYQVDEIECRRWVMKPARSPSTRNLWIRGGMAASPRARRGHLRCPFERLKSVTTSAKVGMALHGQMNRDLHRER